MVQENKEKTKYVPYVNLSSVKLFKLGKNQFDISKISAKRGITLNNDKTLSIEEYGVVTDEKLSQVCPTLKSGQNITFNFTTTGEERILLQEANISIEKNTILELTNEMLNSHMIFYCKRENNIDSSATVSNIQIEIGTVSTEYEPYVSFECYSSLPDGDVDNVTSLYPTTILTSDSNSVIIECEYNVDIEKFIFQKIEKLRTELLL